MHADTVVAEISGDKLGVWYDISIIPTGPKSGVSLMLTHIMRCIRPRT